MAWHSFFSFFLIFQEGISVGNIKLAQATNMDKEEEASTAGVIGVSNIKLAQTANMDKEGKANGTTLLQALASIYPPYSNVNIKVFFILVFCIFMT